MFKSYDNAFCLMTIVDWYERSVTLYTMNTKYRMLEYQSKNMLMIYEICWLHICKEYLVHVDENKLSCLIMHHLLLLPKHNKENFQVSHYIFLRSPSMRSPSSITYVATILDGWWKLETSCKTMAWITDLILSPNAHMLEP